MQFDSVRTVAFPVEVRPELAGQVPVHTPHNPATPFDLIECDSQSFINRRAIVAGYKLLSDHEQYDLLFTQGDFLDMFTEGNSRFAVYGLFRFFVEVECNNKENKFIVLKSFVTGKIMDKYSELSS